MEAELRSQLAIIETEAAPYIDRFNELYARKLELELELDAIRNDIRDVKVVRDPLLEEIQRIHNTLADLASLHADIIGGDRG
jgi:hypothetical protein